MYSITCNAYHLFTCVVDGMLFWSCQWVHCSYCPPPSGKLYRDMDFVEEQHRHRYEVRIASDVGFMQCS